MHALAISIGHNSSAVLIKDGLILAGYEQERFSQKKSDSIFPLDCILELRKRYNLPNNISIFVSHWFPDGILPRESKYWSESKIMEIFPDASIFTLFHDGEMTHHDAHMESALVFAGKEMQQDCHVIVADGFGSLGEHISIYKHRGISKPELLKRYYGFQYSLGLFYQYATAFCGMKMHNHEYKMLAYETHIDEIENPGQPWKGGFEEYIDDFSNTIINKMETPDYCMDLNPLKGARKFVENVLQCFLENFGYEDADDRKKKILISYFAQRHVENVMTKIVSDLKPNNLVVSGGVFYNVKLNNMISKLITGKLCAMPLAGDQGAGLGVYQHCVGGLKWPGHLFWGDRDIDYDRASTIPGVMVTKNIDETYELIKLALKRHQLVNLVRGSMEYGPRALCNTSTLALPKLNIAEQINRMNSRTNEMPFAMVVTPKQADILFHEVDKIHRSLEYMIVTREFRSGYQMGREGGAHYYPLTKTYTCRPQVTRDSMILRLLEDVGPLINTSLNFHGVPIVRSTDNVLYTHLRQLMSMKDSEIIVTIIQKEENR